MSLPTQIQIDGGWGLLSLEGHGTPRCGLRDSRTSNLTYILADWPMRNWGNQKDKREMKESVIYSDSLLPIATQMLDIISQKNTQ